jgi:hypothetical protein
MFRKIVFLVPVFALALLVGSRFVGKIGTDGLAWAQDSPAAADGDQNTNNPPKAIKFSGSGTLDGTITTPCSHVECFSLSGMVTKTSVKGLGAGDITGNGYLDSCTTNEHTRKECCTFSATETYSFSDGDVDVMFSGMACGKNPKKVKAKLPYEIMGGTSMFSGASGSGEAKFTFDEDTLMAKFSFKGKLTE